MSHFVEKYFNTLTSVPMKPDLVHGIVKWTHCLVNEPRMFIKGH